MTTYTHIFDLANSSPSLTRLGYHRLSLRDRSRNIGVGPLKILPSMRLAVAAEARIQHDEVEPASVERVIRLLLLHGAQELILVQRVHAMVSQDVMPVFADCLVPKTSVRSSRRGLQS
jgi:hypothetical protein